MKGKIINLIIITKVSERSKSNNDFRERIATEESDDGVQEEVSVEEVLLPAPQCPEVPAVLNT